MKIKYDNMRYEHSWIDDLKDTINKKKHKIKNLQHRIKNIENSLNDDLSTLHMLQEE